MVKGRRVHLASASSRRFALLKSRFEGESVEFSASGLIAEESQPSNGLDVRSQVASILASKIENAQAEFTIVQNAGKQIPDYIIVADTLVEDPDDPTVSLGQPADKIGAAAMLLRLTGRRHNVWSGTAVISKLSVGWEVKSAVEYATVEIKQLADSDFAELLESDSWVGKAGAYDLAGKMRQFADLYAGSEMCVLGFAPSIIEDLLQRLSNDVKK